MTAAQDGGKVVSLTHRPPLPPGNAPGTHFCSRLIRRQGRSAIGRVMSMKNSNDTIWNRTSDRPISSTAPQPLCHRGPPIKRKTSPKCSVVNYDNSYQESELTIRSKPPFNLVSRPILFFIFSLFFLNMVK